MPRKYHNGAKGVRQMDKYIFVPASSSHLSYFVLTSPSFLTQLSSCTPSHKPCLRNYSLIDSLISTLHVSPRTSFHFPTPLYLLTVELVVFPAGLPPEISPGRSKSPRDKGDPEVNPSPSHRCTGPSTHLLMCVFV